MLPLIRVLPLGLTLAGTTNYLLADGRVSPKLFAHGSIDLSGEVTTGLIALEANGAYFPLLGMEFLRRAKKMLGIGRGGIMLVDEPS